ncbi:hypothetical protein GP486_004683 [Trichoglossum hirsutum]|uniref:Antifreeze protein n=1 Tax=Trichoglossum hirsutum TaxID=265104 RepID=A0A9P8RNM2_9PEZI|nr:hypothetical protein GP486_004683 [Trichoglossum hirsutum]
MKGTHFSACRLALLALITAQYAFGLAHPPIEKRALPVLMGSAATFGAIAASSLSSSGATAITVDCGTCPGTSITGFPPGTASGAKSAGGTIACNAEADCLTAYNNAAGLTPTTALGVSDLGGLTLPPGIYSFPTSWATLSTTLTLNGTADPNGQFIFQITTTYSTSSGSQVLLINGAQACNLYFKIGSSATIISASALQGNYLAYTSITVGEGSSNQGTLCALNGAISLIDNALTAQTSCST